MNLLYFFNFPEYVTLFQRRFSIYFILGHLGLGISFLVNGWFCLRLKLPLDIYCTLYLVAVLSFYGSAWLRKAWLGHEHYVLLRSVLFIHLTIGGTLGLWGVSYEVALHFLDLLAIAIAWVIALGRLGCQTVGCCEGRAYRGSWYVAYPRLGSKTRGIRLIPVQLMESIFAFSLAWVGVLVKLKGISAGEFWISFWLLYTSGRYIFEFFRGDIDRPYWLGFSEAQWIGTVIWGILIGASLLTRLPIQVWHYVLATLGLSVTLLWAIWRSQQKVPWYQLTQPLHLQEFGQAALDSQLTNGLQITRRHINVSVMQVEPQKYLYTISHQNHPLPEVWAKRLFRHLQLTRYPEQRTEMRTGSTGMYHMLRYQSGDKPRPNKKPTQL